LHITAISFYTSISDKMINQIHQFFLTDYRKKYFYGFITFFDTRVSESIVSSCSVYHKLYMLYSIVSTSEHEQIPSHTSYGYWKKRGMLELFFHVYFFFARSVVYIFMMLYMIYVHIKWILYLQSPTPCELCTYETQHKKFIWNSFIPLSSICVQSLSSWSSWESSWGEFDGNR